MQSSHPLASPTDPPARPRPQCSRRLRIQEWYRAMRVIAALSAPPRHPKMVQPVAYLSHSPGRGCPKTARHTRGLPRATHTPQNPHQPDEPWPRWATASRADTCQAVRRGPRLYARRSTAQYRSGHVQPDPTRQKKKKLAERCSCGCRAAGQCMALKRRARRHTTQAYSCSARRPMRPAPRCRNRHTTTTTTTTTIAAARPPARTLMFAS